MKQIHNRKRIGMIALAPIMSVALSGALSAGIATADEQEVTSQGKSSSQGLQVKFRPITDAQRSGKQEEDRPASDSSSSSGRSTSSSRPSGSNNSGTGVRDYSDGGTILPDDYGESFNNESNSDDEDEGQYDELSEIDNGNDDEVILPPSNPDLSGSSSLSDLDVSYNGSVAEKAVKYAASKMGAPYVWGATGPDTFDCSGLTQWAYKQAGLDITRTTYTQVNDGPKVSVNDVKPGDLVFYGDGLTHMAIAKDSNTVIHAPQPGDVVQEAAIDMMPIVTIVRVAT